MIGWIVRLLMIAAGAGTSSVVARDAVNFGDPDDGGAPAAHAHRGRAGVLALPLDDPAQPPAEIPMAEIMHVLANWDPTLRLPCSRLTRGLPRTPPFAMKSSPSSMARTI